MVRFIVTLIILSIAIFLLQIDNKLNPDAKNWLVGLDDKQSSQSYIYLLGIDVGLGDKPIQIGEQIFKSTQLAEENYFSGNEVGALFQYPEQKKIPLPNTDYMCDLDNADCVDSFLTNQYQIEELINKNIILVERFKKFLSYEDFSVLAKPLIDTPIPAYVYLSNGNQLYLLEQIILSERENPGLAINNLLDHFNTLKKYLASSNTMISKMVFTNLLSDTIDALWVIQNKDKSIEKITLKELSEAEKDLLKAFMTEYQFMYLLYQNLDKHPEFMQETGDMPGWSVRLLFKPNMTANKAYYDYNNYYELSKMDMKEFYHYINSQEPEEKSVFSLISIRNPIGKILYEIAKPDLKNYIARINNLNAKIMLFNNIKINNNKLIYSHIDNPYYPDHRQPAALDNNKKICFKTPLEYQKHDACLAMLF